MSSTHEVTTATSGSSISKPPWTIISTTLPISNAGEISAMQEELGGLPLPEMPFGNNSLVIRHENLGWEYKFDTLEALRLVRLGDFEFGDGGVQVGYAKEWLKSR
jgi:type 2A phosphatase activator TIP41